MKKTVIVNIYHFIRMSYEEPSRFLKADYDTTVRQIQLLKQHGLPSTYALKYDALMNPSYQKLLLDSTDANDEIAAWWEITGLLCVRAGVPFRGKTAEEFDERVDSAYSVGYEPSERIRLLDAYMEDFYSVFGYYPKTIGSWVLDSVTLDHAVRRYGVMGAAICRDQLGTDGFTLWGGYPNGIYFPSRHNEFMPAQTVENQLSAAMFRLLSPDPVYSFEQDARKGLSGVYTLEPCCQNGRDKNRISWYFSRLTEEDSLGIGYAQIGQENNFLWENIKPGFAPQLDLLVSLSKKGLLRIETMEESAAWFSQKYRLTPPLSWQASESWNRQDKLSAQWYASRNYRIGFLAENKHLRIRDWFLYEEEYPSRYLNRRLGGRADDKSAAPGASQNRNAASTMDALPLLFPQKWMSEGFCQGRPFVRILEAAGGLAGKAPAAQSPSDVIWREPEGRARFYAIDELCACAALLSPGRTWRFTMKEASLTLEAMDAPPEDGQPDSPQSRFTDFALCFDCLPTLEKADGQTLHLRHEGFSYSFKVDAGKIVRVGRQGVLILAENGCIRLCLSKKQSPPPFSEEYMASPAKADAHTPRWIAHPSPKAAAPPFAPSFSPADSVFGLDSGSEKPAFVRISVPEREALIRYTTDGAEPDGQSPLYAAPVPVTADMVLTARSFLPDGRVSDIAQARYRYSYRELVIKSNTVFDTRPVFCRSGIQGLLDPSRGSLDYQDGRWLATLEDLDFTCLLPVSRFLDNVSVGFLSCHRSGIIYPKAIELYLGDGENSLRLFDTIVLPCAPAEKEIEKKEFTFHPHRTVSCLRIIARRYERMPQWCCYKGVPDVFTLADSLILS